MGQQIKGFPRFPKHSQTVILGSTRYRVTFTWRQRALAWYFDLHDVDGNQIVMGRRLSAKASPIAGIGFEVGAAPKYLFVRATDGYQRDELGSTVVLVRYSPDEVAEAKAARDAGSATADDLVVV